MIINYTDVMKPHWEDRKKQKISNPYNFTPREYMKIILEAINKQCSKGYRFNGIITSPLMNSGGSFLFEESKKKYKYVWKFDDEIVKYADLQRRRGGIISDKQMIQLYEAMGNIHAVVYLPEISERLVFFVADEEKDTNSGDITLKMYRKYENSTGKKAIWQGKETKGYIIWLDMYDRNQLKPYEK